MKTHRKYRIVKECGFEKDYFHIEVKKGLFWLPQCSANGPTIIYYKYTSSEDARNEIKSMIRQERRAFVKTMKEKREENNRKKSRKVIYEV